MSRVGANGQAATYATGKTPSVFRREYRTREAERKCVEALLAEDRNPTAYNISERKKWCEELQIKQTFPGYTVWGANDYEKFGTKTGYIDPFVYVDESGVVRKKDNAVVSATQQSQEAAAAEAASRLTVSADGTIGGGGSRPVYGEKFQEFLRSRPSLRSAPSLTPDNVIALDRDRTPSTSAEIKPWVPYVVAGTVAVGFLGLYLYARRR